MPLVLLLVWRLVLVYLRRYWDPIYLLVARIYQVHRAQRRLRYIKTSVLLKYSRGNLNPQVFERLFFKIL